jgi:hypothetical protein
VVLPNWVDASFIEACRNFVENSDGNEWGQGDNSAHSWKEWAGEMPFDIPKSLSLNLIGRILGKPIIRYVQWFNVYTRGQFIPSHRDISGDAQLNVCIEVPSVSHGGQLWLNSSECIVPMGVGDVLLFGASAIPHGTTPVDGDDTTRRVVLNVRLWT